MLIDDRGSVYDTAGGIEWDSDDNAYRRDDLDRHAPPQHPDGRWRSSDGGTTVTTTSAGGACGGGTTTTVVVRSAPVVTTTTTEVYEDAVTYTRPPVRTWTKRRWTPTKTICRCH